MGAQARSSGAYAAMIPTEQGRAASMLNMVSGMPPQLQSTNIMDLNKMMNTMDMLRRYTSRAEEQELDPATAAARMAAEQAMADNARMAATGQLTPAIQRSLMTQALMSSGETGIRPDSSFGRMNLASLFGRGAFGLQNQLQNQVNQWLQTQQAPTGGISPEAAANLSLSEKSQNLAAQNAWRQQLLGAAGAGQQGLSQLGMGALQSGVSEDIANTAARNQLMNSLIGAGIGAAGSAAGGPLGGVIAKQLFTPSTSGNIYRT